MAKRKAARPTDRKTASAQNSASRARSGARTAAGRPKAAKTGARRPARGAQATARKPAARKAATRKTVSSRKAAPKKTARKAASPKATARKTAKPARKATSRAAAPKPAARQTTTRPAASRKAAKPASSTRKAAPKATPRSDPRKSAVSAAQPRKAPGLDRTRRRMVEGLEEELPPSPPSSLDLDRSASAVRSGRKELHERYAQHTDTSPALTGGDVDADWESAYSVGDEAPGGDNPTPDQDIVDDIGRAVGVEYQDNEELKGADKVAKRDKNRWELDPASSDDWDDR